MAATAILKSVKRP